jgi:hypothetical protein
MRKTFGSQVSSLSWMFATLAVLLGCPEEAPTVVSTTPANAATRVSRDTTVTATFSKEMDPATLNTSTFTLRRGTTSITGTVTASGSTATFTPGTSLAENTVYTATITMGARDLAGVPLAEAISWSFTTAGPSGLIISGRVTYDWVPAKDNVSEGGVRLDYGAKIARPARRVVVQAFDPSNNNNVVSETTTDDDGQYTLSNIPPTVRIFVRVLARSRASNSVQDGIAPEACSGASWDIRVVDNTQSKAQYVLMDSRSPSPPVTDMNLHAALTFDSGYSNRSAAVFAILDTMVSGIERVCEGTPNPNLPPLYVNWSPNNVPTAGDKSVGQISTSHYTTEGGVGNLYILGRENVDTDEYDDHVIAHEFGHYLENKLYRSDSIGGPHTSGDVLDPRVAFGEGYGNAFSAMVFHDPVYVDTGSVNQASGFVINMEAVPSTNDRGVYSEGSVQHFLWKLYDYRNTIPSSGRYDRIHSILAGGQKTTPALTTLQSFAAYYNASFGRTAENLEALWASVLGGDYNSLCSGACSGAGDTADPFDVDNDLGIRYSTAGRVYNGSTRSAEFWRLYKTISGAGFPAPGNAHEVTSGNILGANKLGVNRWYRYVGTGSPRTIQIVSPGGEACPASDTLDADVYDTGSRAVEATTIGCEALSVPGVLGRTYVIVVRGFNGASDVTGWGLTITGGKPTAPVSVASSLSGPLEAEVDTPVTLSVTPGVECSELTTEVRGIDGVTISGRSVLSHARCVAGRAVTHPVVARVPPGTLGYAAVTVSFTAEGQRYSDTRTFAVRAKGDARPAAKLATPDARVEVDREGNRFILMRSAP